MQIKININEIRTIELVKSKKSDRLRHIPARRIKKYVFFGSKYVFIPEMWSDDYYDNKYITKQELIDRYLNRTMTYNMSLNKLLPFKWGGEKHNDIYIKDCIVITLKDKNASNYVLAYNTLEEAQNMYKSIDESYVKKNKFIVIDDE